MSKIKTFDYSNAIGREFGNYVVVRELGRGAMAAVFIAYQKTLKRQVAIKLLPKALATTKIAQQQFRDEAETIAVLDHPNLITIFDSGEDDDYFFQVMQLVDGMDLAAVLNKLRRHPVTARRVLPMAHVLRLVTEVLAGLTVAHDGGVVHQDLKPANILIENKGGRALIADFGIAKAKQAEYLARGLVVGTPIYLSPEQASAQDTDLRTDLYAVGVILFELLAGKLPIRMENANDTVSRKIRNPESFFLSRPIDCHPRITPALETVVLRATQTDPARRYVNAEAFSDALIEAWS
ncbi:MAG: serine/threonine-protein kinase [Pseudomonadota bacterium]